MSRLSALCISALVLSSACGGQVSLSPSDLSDASSGAAGQIPTADALAGSGGAQDGAAGAWVGDGSAGAWIKDGSAGAPPDSPSDSEPVADTSSDSAGAIEAAVDAAADHDAVAEADSEAQADAPDDALIDADGDADSEDGPEMVDADASESPQCQIDAPSGFTPVCPEYSCITCSAQEQPLCAEVCAVQGCFHCDAGEWHIRSITCEAGCFDAGLDAPLEDGGPDGTCAPSGCVIAICQSFGDPLILECGDCADNDGDGLIDMDDPDCTGPCDWNEVDFGHAPGGNESPCSTDCFFDEDFGTGNDCCSWNLRCDPLAKSSPAMPDPHCKYKPDLEQDCQTMTAEQAPLCNALCEPITPNGCDCFGCCEHPAGSGSFVWLGSENWQSYEHQHCSMALIDDPTRCHPCTPVPSCFNPCEGCELCFGMTALAAGCDQQQCPSGSQPCGLPCQPHCPAGQFCLTGCCIAKPSW